MNSEVTTGYILAAILVAAGITFLLRLLPFGLKKALAGSELLDALSHWIPLGRGRAACHLCCGED